MTRWSSLSRTFKSKNRATPNRNVESSKSIGQMYVFSGSALCLGTHAMSEATRKFTLRNNHFEGARFEVHRLRRSGLFAKVWLNELKISVPFIPHRLWYRSPCVSFVLVFLRAPPLLCKSAVFMVMLQFACDVLRRICW